MDRLLFTVPDEGNGMRLDLYVSSLFTEQTRSRIQKRIEKGEIRVNGQTVKTGYRLRPGDRIEADAEEISEPADAEPEAMELTVVYEDEDLAVIDKPQGLVVHPSAGHGNGTLVNGLLWHFQGNLSGINGVLRPGIVHRLDKDTSGLLVICKSDRAHQGLSRLLETHDITRKYHAIVHGNLSQDTGTVNAPIGRSPRDRKKMAVVADGRRAVTHYRVLERFGAFTYMELELETGRTHQIRVHMKSIQHPVLGDPVYGPQRIAGAEKRLLAGADPELLTQGQFLHAKVLGFVHPVTGRYMEWDSPLPARFASVLACLRRAGGGQQAENNS